MSTCRSAISEILKRTQGIRRALLPSFTCHSVLKPFIDLGIEVYPYSLRRDLSIDINCLNREIDTIKPDIILVHKYFGFDTINVKDDYFKGKGVIVIEDLTQCLFSSFDKTNADYYVGSIRKWMPIPDGAILTGYDIEESAIEDEELVKAKLKALKHKGDYLINGKGNKEVYMKEFKEAENILDSRNRTYKMSSASKAIFNDTDINKMKEQRRQNWCCLHSYFQDCDLFELIFKNLPDDVVPFMYPVLVKENREQFQQYMASNDIYPTVIWACPEEFNNRIDNVAYDIYDRILCFHCDQRYGLTDMQKIIMSVKSYRK